MRLDKLIGKEIQVKHKNKNKNVQIKREIKKW